MLLDMYVDDLIVIGCNQGEVDAFKEEMKRSFKMSDLGCLSYYLGIKVKRQPGRIMLSQAAYAAKLLEKAGMTNCNTVQDPMENCPKLIGYMSRFMANSTTEHLSAVKHILWYRAGTLHYGLSYPKGKGGHSIGQLHCAAFFERLWDFQGQNITDPSMDPEFAESLKAQCPRDNPLLFKVADSTNATFDAAYYLDLLIKKGLMDSYLALMSDPLGVEYAIKAVQDPYSFLFEFGMAMIKMGNIPASDLHGWRKICVVIEPCNF
ncbi:hypothetical protein AXG93_1190s1010 [Marchantia polymorpha subsp. ruderalis]|uniref:Plant heme peroxidase family profile domain-containing protein n=1 Tax=Marchantia polymorpha subsp. ruderalis TaxID=1480154 RepID=A0A176WC30_MARPO|nr:hypothetical protein AXG93_1190s1010 [Marchantia polymorpha subsp. ruderalis]